MRRDSAHGNSRTLVSLHEFPRPLLTVAKHAPLHTGIDSSSVDSGLSVSFPRLCSPGYTYIRTRDAPFVLGIRVSSFYSISLLTISVERHLKQKARGFALITFSAVILCL